MDRIFIPTVFRADNQISYNHLSPSLQKKTTLVVQAWEKKKYSSDFDLLVLPRKINIYDDYLCLAKTREIIHREGKNTKYVMMDDDMTFKRRNAKYWTGVSDMEKSKRDCTLTDVNQMFSLFTKWLDEEYVSFVSPSHEENPPLHKSYSSNSSCCSCVGFNGKDFAHMLKELPTSEIKYAEDTLLYLTLLSLGYGNRISTQFCAKNHSVATSNLPDTVWDMTRQRDVDRDHKFIEKRFSEFYKILRNEDGSRVRGGFRDFGKVSVKYSQCYKVNQKRRMSA